MDLLRCVDSLTAVAAEKERIVNELTAAGRTLEPSALSPFPAGPDRAAFDVCASAAPAKEAGGFCDVFLLDGDHLALVVAGVSGKGIPTAVFAAFTKLLVNDRARMGGTPGEILTFVNSRICESGKADMSATVWMGILEIPSGRIVAASAGHGDPALCRKGGTFEIRKTRRGKAIGAAAGEQYLDDEVCLVPGDKLFLYAGGALHAADEKTRAFALQELLQALNSKRDNAPQDVLETVRAQANAFAVDAPQIDDLTMLCLEYKGGDPNVKTLTVDALTENLKQVSAFVDAFLEERDCSMKTQMQIDLCVEEIFVNIAHYAYPENTGKAEICVSEADGVVTLTFMDGGVPYDPLQKKDPDTTLAAEDRQIGGLGIFLVKKNMDTVSYRYENGKNVLTMTKTI